jgi:hypothetical protein
MYANVIIEKIPNFAVQHCVNHSADPSQTMRVGAAGLTQLEHIVKSHHL